MRKSKARRKATKKRLKRIQNTKFKVLRTSPRYK